MKSLKTKVTAITMAAVLGLGIEAQFLLPAQAAEARYAACMNCGGRLTAYTETRNVPVSGFYTCVEHESCQAQDIEIRKVEVTACVDCGPIVERILARQKAIFHIGKI